MLPGNTVNLNGSLSFDPDNNITGYLWTKISGPSSFNITNANVEQTPVINLVQGVYLFELKVTDAGVLFDRDTIQITVMAVNQPPACTNCKIVFVSDRDGNAEIYSCNADGSNISRLTNNAGIDDQPAWSPDGSHIAFVSDRTGYREIYIMNADGSNVVRRTFSGGYSVNPAWSPDGARIAYSASSNGGGGIWVVGAVSGSPSVLFEEPGRIAYPSWSPDGTKLALVSDWFAYDFVYDIFTINADGTNFTALTDDIFDQIDYVHPSWSPGGTKLAVAIINHWIGASQYNTQVGVMSGDGSGLTAIISGADSKTRTSWSADGTKIAYTSLLGSRKDISWVSADGSASGTIVTNGWNADWQH
jgi:TolB protein